MSTVVVRYRTHAESTDENQALIEQVFAELNAENPDGIEYAAYRLEDDTFIHIAKITAHDNPLIKLPAFKEFQKNISDRCLPGEAPDVKPASLVGSYDSSKLGV